VSFFYSIDRRKICVTKFLRSFFCFNNLKYYFLAIIYDREPMIKALIFDFDGTLADTLPYTFSKIIELSKKYKIKGKEEEIIEKIRSKTPRELMKEFQISWFKMPIILWEIHQAQKALYQHIRKIKIFPGIKMVLKALKKKNIRLFICSSNIKKNIDEFLKKEKLEDYFEKIYVGKSLLGKDKDLLYILKKEGLKNNEVYYVADEIRDVLACQKAKIKMIGVSWGLAGQQNLKKAGVDILVQKPTQILKFIYS